MAWKEMRVLEQRKEFIKDYNSGDFKISELSRIYDISRPTAYLWIERFLENGEKGLIDRISTPHNQPLITPSNVVEEIINLKCRKPFWEFGTVLGPHQKAK